MFDKILIANRGEIACRVMRTAARLGVATVAVYSEADAGALHVLSADEAICIGPAASAESYLRADKIIEACRATGAQAVHPGYGFLSENADFARRLAEAGIAFIGPPPSAIDAMGDKITSKGLAEAAGVNTVPGFADIIRDAAHAAEIAGRIGYPVMLKASAGGGGKGMRVAHDEAECREGFVRASNEARSSFGDDRVFIEKFIVQPRHIEIQVLADGHGNAVYLGERECSIQRRHQKVLEEAPSPFLDEPTRRAMGEQAVALARAVDYCSAGTVEFIVDRERNFYFLEMNTRLQVEHPVTEIVTGLDLVEWMLRIADGEALDFTQADVKLSGWAIEARVYAEDPFRGFLPSTGRLSRYREPSEQPGVRVDSGVREGGEVSIFYDPMIAKLIGFGPDRSTAIARARDALDGYVIRGPGDNTAFLSTLLRHPRFVAGDISTAFIEEEYPGGFTEAHVVHEDPRRLVAIGAWLHARAQNGQTAATVAAVTMHPDRRDEYVVSMQVGDGGPHDDAQIDVDGHVYRIRSDWRSGSDLFDGIVNDAREIVQVARDGIDWRLRQHGFRLHLRVLSPRAGELFRLMPIKAPADLSGFLLSPMPGLLVSVLVEPGDEVEAGTDLAVVEAMKMENVLRAERDAVVKQVLAAAGDSLAVDQPIIEYE